MRLDQVEKYRSTEVNRDLYLVHYGPALVGQVRRGVDMLWYPELPGEHYKSAALQRVILANEAITSYMRSLDGNG